MSSFAGGSSTTRLDQKDSVRAATTADIVLSGLQTIDAVSLVAGNRVLVKDQSVPSENGIYVASTTSWNRSVDASNGTVLTANTLVWVEEGATNDDKGFVLDTNNPVTVGTTPLSFRKYTGLGLVTAGDGLTKSGDTINAVANADGSIIANPDDLQVGVLATDAQHGVRGGGTQHADVIAAGASGFMTGADKTKLDGVEALADVTDTVNVQAALPVDDSASLVRDPVDNTRQVRIDAGTVATATTRVLTMPDADITPDDVSGSRPPSGTASGGLGGTYPSPTVDGMTSGVLTDDTAHGTRGGGTLHADVIAAGASGFMIGTDKTKLDGLAVATDGSIWFTAGGAGAPSGDNANLFWDNTNKRLGIGVTNPAFKLEAQSNSSDGFVFQVSSDGASPFYVLRRTRGTLSAKAIVLSGTELGIHTFQGFDGVNFHNAATIRGVVDGTPGLNDMPGRLEFQTTADGASISTTRMTIKNDGKVGIGTPTPAFELDVVGSAQISGTLHAPNIRATSIDDFVSTANAGINFGGASKTITFETNATNRMLIDDKVNAVMGASGSFSTVGGVADSQFTDVGNVGLGEDTLQTFTLPANALNANGKAIRIRATFRTANNANVKTIKIHFGATVIGQSGAAALDDRIIYFDVIVVRTGASAQRTTAFRVEGADGALADNTLVLRTTPAEDTTLGIVIKGTGETTTDVNDDVIQESMLIEFLN